jgi:hypothetical protein
VLTRSNGIEPAFQMEVPAGPYCDGNEVAIAPHNGTLEGKGDPAKGERPPAESMVKPTMASVFGKTRLLTRVAYRYCPLKVAISPPDAPWALNGDPCISVSVPVVGSHASAEMVPATLFITYTVLADAVRVRGPRPTGNGDPGTEVKAPVEESNENAATELAPVKATYKKLPRGVVAANPGVERVEADNAIG